jgi:hypothetical protein
MRLGSVTLVACIKTTRSSFRLIAGVCVPEVLAAGMGDEQQPRMGALLFDEAVA